MFLHYLKKKENDQKVNVKKIYFNIIQQIDVFTKKSEFSLKKEFNTSFELTILIFYIIFKINKNKHKHINQELMNLLINDLDYSFRKIGISEINIGKYVKKHVKKIYFRFKKLDSIFEINNFIDFKNFISKLDILITKEKDHEFSDYLYKYINKNLKKSDLKEKSNFLFVDPM